MAQKIGLIIPPSPFLCDERVFVSLGILRIAAVLKQKNYPVDVLDLSGIRNYEDVVQDYLASSNSNKFAITSTTPQMPQSAKICKIIKEHNPKATLIIGGPHMTAVGVAKKNETKKSIVGRGHKAFQCVADMVDVMVAGDGEEAIFIALEDNSPSFIDADDPTSSLFLTKEQLSDLPFPARELIDLDSYHYYMDNRRAISMMFEQGCPFSCRFCSQRASPSFRRVRPRTIGRILEEIKEIIGWGFRAIQIYDDEIGLIQSKIVSDLKAIIALQEETGIDLRFRGFIKAELFTSLQAKLMYETGFREICVGFESGAPKILKNIKKQATLDDNNRCCEYAKENGLRIKAFTSIGHPGETFETAEQTKDWLISAGVDDFDTTVISPFPGVNYYDDAIPHKTMKGIYTYKVPETGDLLHCFDVDYTKTAEYYKGDKNLGYVSHVFTEALTPEEIVRLRDWIEDSVRQKLGIPFYQTMPAKFYEASMGQLPGYIYRRSDNG